MATLPDLMKQRAPGRKRPPRLRSADTDQQNCGNCRHFDGRGMCALYSYPVRAEQVSDSFQPRRGS